MRQSIFPPMPTAQERKLKNRIEDTFTMLSGNIIVYSKSHSIFVWAGISNGAYPGYWTGSPCGAIHGEQALQACIDTAQHLIKYRELLPKACREYAIEPIIFTHY